MTIPRQNIWVKRFSQPQSLPSVGDLNHSSEYCPASKHVPVRQLPCQKIDEKEGLEFESIELANGDEMRIWRDPANLSAARSYGGERTITFFGKEHGPTDGDSEPNVPEFQVQLNPASNQQDAIVSHGRILLQIKLGDATMKALSDATGSQESIHLPRESRLYPARQQHTQVLQDIMTSDILPSLRLSYLSAKGAELVCLALATVATVPQHSRSQNLRSVDLVKAEQARQLLHDDLASPPRLERLARKVGLNRSKLAACFKHLYGCGVYEYSRRERLLFGRRLLAETEASVFEVAVAIGYESISSFSKSFKAEFGVSPRACRAGISMCV
ncbi:AraC family transcriptional regulator [Parasphingorhabdus sp.]|uniref:AraC family transcriptional regulator n=1 Tax=Parasphingorhabdus sp. TaxID=2709688 RepID=UPI0032EDA155